MLYLVATPIGNLEDITLRSLRILNEVDLVYAEDTRHTLKLFNHFDIHKPLFACHAHNERQAAEQIVSLLQEGKQIALVSDAGLPGISDPGSVVVQQVVAANLPFTVLPGACAATTALVLSGLSTSFFSFAGFLPREKKQRIALCAVLQKQTGTIILYESPHRLKDTIRELYLLFGARPAAVCREITKKFEQCIRGTLLDLPEKLPDEVKGECVLVLQGAASEIEDLPSLAELLVHMQKLISQGRKAKESAKLLANDQYSANQLYQAFLLESEPK